MGTASLTIHSHIKAYLRPYGLDFNEKRGECVGLKQLSNKKKQNKI
jgi:hypothetical protein